MKKNEYHVLGIMSGTSLDGIDLALCAFEASEPWKFRIIHAETTVYPRDWKEKLSGAVSLDQQELGQLDGEYTRYLAEIILQYLSREGNPQIDAICSHGHTVRHEPEKGFTLQIGNLPKLAKLTGHKVICDFRVEDVRLGGQGAPLVPVGDQLLFSGYQACLNLGGFANISLAHHGKRIAFDICAVNTVLNFLAGRLDLEYDKDGEIALSGKPDRGLLEILDGLEFYRQAPPKSLGIEWVHKNILPLFSGAEDIPGALHTYTVHAAVQIAAVMEKYGIRQVLVTGGGAFNKFLVDQIRRRTSTVIIIPGSEVVNYKEALIFGFLGVLRLRNEVNILGSVTGAKMDHSSGKIFQPKG